MKIRLGARVLGPSAAVLAAVALLGGGAPARADARPAQPSAQVETVQARLEAMEARVLVLIQQDRHAEADALLAELLQLEIETYGPTDWRVANSHGFRADLAESAGDMAVGEGHRRREVEVLAAGSDPARLATARISLALNLAVQGRHAEALPLLDDAARAAEGAAGADDLGVQIVLARAHVLTGQGRRAEAEALLAEADADHAAAAPSLLVARLAHALAVARVDQDRPAEAEAPARRACAMADALDPPDLQVVATACFTLASALTSLDRTAEAAPFARRAMEAHEALGAESVLQSGHVAEAAAVLIRTAPEAEREPFFRMRLAALAPGEDEPADAAWADAANSLGLWLTAHERGGEAVELLRRSVAVYEARQGADHRNTAIVRTNLVDALRAAGQAAEAESLAVELLPALIDAPDLEGSQFVLLKALEGRPQDQARLLTAMAERRDARGATTAERVDLYSRLANLAANRFDWTAAVGWRRKAVEALRADGAAEPGFSLSLAYYGRALGETGDHAGAYAALSEAWTRLEPRDIPDSERFYVAQRLSEAALRTGRLDEADRLNRLALAGWRTRPDAAQSVIGTLMGLSDILIARSELGQAEAALDEALVLARAEDEAGGDVAMLVESARAGLWKMQGRYDAAEAAMRRVIDHVAARYGPESPQLAVPLKNLGLFLGETERPERALPLFERAAAIEARHLPPDSAELINSRVRIAALMTDMGRAEEALAMLTDLADRAEAALGPGHSVSLQARERVGWTLAAQGRYGEAAGHFQRTVLAVEDVWGPDDYALMGPLQALAYARYMEGRLDETLAVMRRTVEVGERGGARWPRSLAQVKANLGMTLLALNRPGEALEPLRDAVAISRQGVIAQAAGGLTQMDLARYPFRRLVEAAYRAAAGAG